MSDVKGNSEYRNDEHDTGDDALDRRIRRLELAVDDRHAKVIAGMREIKEMLLETRQDFGKAHVETMVLIGDLAKRMPQPQRRKPKRGKR